MPDSPVPSPSHGPAGADNTDRWLAELRTTDPDRADRAVSDALDLVRDVTRVPRDVIAAALRAPDDSAACASYDKWFRYGLRLVRLGLYGAGSAVRDGAPLVLSGPHPDQIRRPGGEQQPTPRRLPPTLSGRDRATTTVWYRGLVRTDPDGARRAATHAYARAARETGRTPADVRESSVGAASVPGGPAVVRWIDHDLNEQRAGAPSGAPRRPGGRASAASPSPTDVVPFAERSAMMRWLVGLYATDPAAGAAVLDGACAAAVRADGCTYGEAWLSVHAVRRGHQFVVGRLVERALYDAFKEQAA